LASKCVIPLADGCEVGRLRSSGPQQAARSADPLDDCLALGDRVAVVHQHCDAMAGAMIRNMYVADEHSGSGAAS
jgi:hypothetical protein